MRDATAQKVANLLCSVAATLGQVGRPRKRPGHWRDDAQTPWGSGCRPSCLNAVSYSLFGAIQANARLFGYGYNVRRYAMLALLDADDNAADWYGWDTLRMAIIGMDDAYYDTRHVIRLAKKAQHAVEKKLIAA